MNIKNLQEKLLNKRVKRVKNKPVSQFNIKSFRIIKGNIIKLEFGMYNDAFNTNSERLYLKTMFKCNPQGFISYLKELSNNVEAIQLEFDNYNNSNNIEVEIYIDSSIEFKEKYLNLGKIPTSISLNNNFYNKVIEAFEM